ncbi:MBL fold metallo-hydrolase [Desulfotomaculum copahuensis]|uniref:Metallo-beta-lactamase domain-containing protein n=1 Tax=Desulfotomaculum copahuensis TaxID=1838280 RepID=A0A1B7LHJ3_9FIRM|nr:MBL fold metallo-hydrolase [Desulfotomaculum copahuensis]OAT85759.1 hypothetical protein A6M21_04480 [Desulfotomaculum copahuensis]
MLPVHRIVVPTPYPVGPVNAYLITARPYTLVDPGPDTEQAREVLREGVVRQGLQLEQIERVMLTHYHSDHSGLAQWVHELSGAPVYLHPYELPKLSGNYDFVSDRLPFVLEAGVPEEVIRLVTADRDRLPKPFVCGENVVTLLDGEELPFEGGSWQVLHLPGHAPGHLCFYDRQGGVLLSGDFLLPHITPNPMLEPDPENPLRRNPSLTQYLAGLERIKAMDIERVWPGHGESMADYRPVVAASQQHHRERCDELTGLLRQNGEMTAFQLSRRLYPDLKGFNNFLGLSEVQAHLDVLESRGRVRGQKKAGVVYYRTAGDA